MYSYLKTIVTLGIRRTKQYKEKRNNLQSSEKTTLYSETQVCTLLEPEELQRKMGLISDNKWACPLKEEKCCPCTASAYCESFHTNIEVLQREVDGDLCGTPRVRLTAPAEFFSSSLVHLHSVHCLTCPILPGTHRKRESNQSASLEKSGKKTNSYSSVCSCEVAESKPHLFFRCFPLGRFLFGFATIFPSGLIIFFILIFVTSLSVLFSIRLWGSLEREQVGEYKNS